MVTGQHSSPESPLFQSHDRSSNPHRRRRLLIVDDDPPICEACEAIAKELALDTCSTDSIGSARRILQEDVVDIVLLDLRIGTENGLALLSELHAHAANVPVVIMTAFATVGSAVTALRAGAFDYIQKPFSIEELTVVLEAAVHRAYRTCTEDYSDKGRLICDSLELVGDCSPAIERIRRIVSRVALATHPVLIEGESGTGKGLLARSIHLNGPASAGPFVSVDCTALSADEIEALLFGTNVATSSEDGASGALTSEPGGTVFLNEIGHLPSTIQSRLLLALEHKAILPYGSSEMVPITARVLVASSCNLAELVDLGRFRKDLFLRLNILNLHLPPLRERKNDIPHMSARILDRTTLAGQPRTLDRTALQLMMEYDWPGNLRELESAIEYACVVSSDAELHLSDLPKQIQDYASSRAELHADPGMPEIRDAGWPISESQGSNIVLPMAEIEKNAILNTLRQLNGDRLLAARLLGIGKTTLYRKLKEYQSTEGHAS